MVNREPLIKQHIKEVTRGMIIKEVPEDSKYWFVPGEVYKVKTSTPWGGWLVIGMLGKDRMRWRLSDITVKTHFEETEPVELEKIAPERLARIEADEAIEDDFQQFKEIVNDLLANLPEKTIKKFAISPEYETYASVIENGQPEEVRKEFVESVDRLLVELPEKAIREFVVTDDYEIYKRVAKRYGVEE